MGAQLEDALQMLAGFLVADVPLGETMVRIADAAKGAIPKASAVRLTLLDSHGHLAEVVVADDLSGIPAEEHEAGLRSLPLVAAGAEIGTLTIYGADRSSISERQDAERLATRAAVVLANAKAYWDMQERATGLQEAMQSRAVIEQAKGKLMATYGGTPDEAFERLTRASQHENVKLRDVARRIVDGTPD